MNAYGFADDIMTSNPTVTVHRRAWVRKTRSAFSYNGRDLLLTDGRWQTRIVDDHHGLGDCWLMLDLCAPAARLPVDMWGLCGVIGRVDVKLNHCSESFSGADLYMFLVIGRIARPTVVATGANTCRLTVGLPTYWWRSLWVKPAVRFVAGGCLVSCVVSPEWQVAAASVTYATWRQERQDVEQHVRPGGLVLVHGTTKETTDRHAAEFWHSQPLPFKNPTKDIIVAVTGGGPDPVLSIELTLDDHVYMQLDGSFSRSIVAEHMYGIADNREPVYFLPFDFTRGEPGRHDLFDTTTCNLTEFKTARLTMRLLPGQYTIFVMARSVNEVRHVDDQMALCWAR